MLETTTFIGDIASEDDVPCEAKNRLPAGAAWFVQTFYLKMYTSYSSKI